MFIQTNQPIIKSFYLKKVPIFCRISDESALIRHFLRDGCLRVNYRKWSIWTFCQVSIFRLIIISSICDPLLQTYEKSVSKRLVGHYPWSKGLNRVCLKNILPLKSPIPYLNPGYWWFGNILFWIWSKNGMGNLRDGNRWSGPKNQHKNLDIKIWL